MLLIIFLVLAVCVNLVLNCLYNSIFNCVLFETVYLVSFNTIACCQFSASCWSIGIIRIQLTTVKGVVKMQSLKVTGEHLQYK